MCRTHLPPGDHTFYTLSLPLNSPHVSPPFQRTATSPTDFHHNTPLHIYIIYPNPHHSLSHTVNSSLILLVLTNIPKGTHPQAHTIGASQHRPPLYARIAPLAVHHPSTFGSTPTFTPPPCLLLHHTHRYHSVVEVKMRYPHQNIATQMNATHPNSPA